MGYIEPRDPKIPMWYNNAREGKSLGTLEEFVKESSLFRATILIERNPFKEVYYLIKRGIMKLIPARFYHFRREKRISKFIESLINPD